LGRAGPQITLDTDSSFTRPHPLSNQPQRKRRSDCHTRSSQLCSTRSFARKLNAFSGNMASRLWLIRSSLCRPANLVPSGHSTVQSCYFGGAWPAYVFSHGVNYRSTEQRPGIRAATNHESELPAKRWRTCSRANSLLTALRKSSNYLASPVVT
jgi:hypothetical protein